MTASHTASRPAPPPPQRHAPHAAPAATHTALDEIALALQLSRASTISLMRLQLAVRSGDRQQAMEALDRFDTLDAEMEGIITRLAPLGDGDTAWAKIGKHLEAQKLALTFEKLALASGIVGPGLVSIEQAWPARPSGPPEPAAAEPAPWEPSADLPDMPDLSPLRTAPDEFEPLHHRPGMPLALWALALILMVAAAIALTLLVIR